MGDHRRRLSAAFASLAIATTAIGFVAPPAAAAPTTTTTSDTTPRPSISPTDTSAPSVETPSPATSTAVPAPSVEPPSPATSTAAPAPSVTATQQEGPITTEGPASTKAPSTQAAATRPEAAAGGNGFTTASALFDELAFQPEDVSSAYDRALFNHWVDADSNGCDTRQEVLATESRVPVTYSSGCTITAGDWYSWYDGASWTNPSDVDIDHLVPLQEAWQSGAYRWTPEQRQAYANDLGFGQSLEAVTDQVNQAKGAKDFAEWKPGAYLDASPNCEYAQAWVAVKWRWNLTVDSSERDALNAVLRPDAQCGSETLSRPDKMDTAGGAATQWPLYKIVYDSSIYEMIPNSAGGSTPVGLSYAKWRDVYAFQKPAPASTDFVKYPWSSSVYAVTFWPGGENYWMWTPLSYNQWVYAGYPAPRNAGWIAGSSYYQWGTSSEIFVKGPDGGIHALNYREWADSGFRSYTRRNNEGFVKLTWAPDLARMSDLDAGAGRPIGYAEWRDEGFPSPAAYQRFQGDQFYQNYGDSTLWYAGPTMNRPVNFVEWRAAGFPAPTIRNAPPGGGGGGTPPTQPGNPGDIKNCTDFQYESQAQAWFDTYYPYYGDVAKLDGNNDGRACESLP